MKRLLAYLFIVLGLGIIINTSIYSKTYAGDKWKIGYKIYPDGKTYYSTSKKENFADSKAYNKCMRGGVKGAVSTTDNICLKFKTRNPEGKVTKHWEESVNKFTQTQIANSEIKKDLEGLLQTLKKAGEMGLTVDVDSTAKTHGFNDFKSAVKFYEKKFKVKLKVEDAKKAFIGIDRSIDIKFTQENSNSIYDIIINSKYKGSKRYKKGYLKVKEWPKQYPYKAFAISMNIEREFAEVTKNPGIKKITPFEWSWGWDNSEYGAKNNALYNCEQNRIKYKVALQECIVVDVNEKNVLFENLPKKFIDARIEKAENSNLLKTNEGKAELSQTENSKEITYKVRIVGKPEGSTSGQLIYFTGLSKNSITDALEKATQRCKNNGIKLICKIYSGRKILKDGTKIKLTKSEIKSGVQKTQIAKTEKHVTPKKKVKVAKKEEPKQEEFKTETEDIDNEAPVIEIAEKITVTSPDYEIEVKVSDKADKIFVEVDGKPSEVKNGKFKIKRYSPIDHQIKIVAIDKWGNRSKEKLVNVKIDIQNNNIVKLEPLNPLNFKGELSKKTIALIIGVETYENAPAAKYASSDAKYFTEYVKNVFGVSQNNIKLLTDEEANLSKTNSAIYKWLPSKIKDNETDLIIFYSGHGLASNDGKSKYILPSNADPDLLSRTAVSRNEFFDQISSLKPNSVTIFFDTCYSGVSRDEEMLLASARPLMIVADEDKKFPENFTIFTASKADQISSGLKEAKHGIFSYYLMKGLEGNADANKDKKITNGELLAYIDENVSQKALELGRQQNPSLAGDPEKVLISYR